MMAEKRYPQSGCWVCWRHLPGQHDNKSCEVAEMLEELAEKKGIIAYVVECPLYLRLVATEDVA